MTEALSREDDEQAHGEIWTQLCDLMFNGILLTDTFFFPLLHTGEIRGVHLSAGTVFLCGYEAGHLEQSDPRCSCRNNER